MAYTPPGDGPIMVNGKLAEEVWKSVPEVRLRET